MELKDFLDLYGIPLTAAAKRIGMSSQHLARILSGKHAPTERLARDISSYTQGAVTVQDVYMIRKRALSEQADLECAEIDRLAKLCEQFEMCLA